MIYHNVLQKYEYRTKYEHHDDEAPAALAPYYCTSTSRYGTVICCISVAPSGGWLHSIPLSWQVMHQSFHVE